MSTAPLLIQEVSQLQEQLSRCRLAKQTIALVPTMGALHQGHLSLVEAANNQADISVVSIFVNPSQFGPTEDLAQYPRNLSHDLKLLASVHTNIVFAPTVEEMYPAGSPTSREPGKSARRWEGLQRPEHFAGVAAAVYRLFELTKPNIAFFGQKDYQQTCVIREMVETLALDIDLGICPIIREADGLAMSSRNLYLSPAQRQQATALYRGLQAAFHAVQQGEVDANILIQLARQQLEDAGIDRIDYVAVVDGVSLDPLHQINANTFMLLAAYVGDTRLIDNLALQPSSL